MKKNRDKNGFITVDFLFAFVLVMGFCIILFSLTLTMTVVQITQYATFAASRSFMAANENPKAQQKLGTAKFEELISSPVFKPFYTGSWFEITAPACCDITTFYPGYEAQNPDFPKLFWGFLVSLKAKVLDFRIPMFGSTTSDDGEGFVTIIGSYLTPEPNHEECKVFNEARWIKIRSLDNSYSQIGSEKRYISLHDNGC